MTQFQYTVEEKKIKTLDHIQESRTKVKAEINKLKEKLQETRDKISEYKKIMNSTQP